MELTVENMLYCSMEIVSQNSSKYAHIICECNFLIGFESNDSTRFQVIKDPKDESDTGRFMGFDISVDKIVYYKFDAFTAEVDKQTIQTINNSLDNFQDYEISGIENLNIEGLTGLVIKKGDFDKLNSYPLFVNYQNQAMTIIDDFKSTGGTSYNGLVNISTSNENKVPDGYLVTGYKWGIRIDNTQSNHSKNLEFLQQLAIYTNPEIINPNLAQLEIVLMQNSTSYLKPFPKNLRTSDNQNQVYEPPLNFKDLSDNDVSYSMTSSDIESTIIHKNLVKKDLIFYDNFNKTELNQCQYTNTLNASRSICIGDHGKVSYIDYLTDFDDNGLTRYHLSKTNLTDATLPLKENH